MIRFFIISLLIFIQVKAYAEENRQLHQENAGTPNAQGWYTGASTLGGFKASFPLPYSDWSIDVEDSIQTINYMGATSADGVKLILVEFPIFDETKSRDIQEITKILAANGKLQYGKIFEYQGFPSSQIAIETDDSIAIFRVVVHENKTYQMSVEYPQDKFDTLEALVNQYFDSLEFKNDTSEINEE